MWNNGSKKMGPKRLVLVSSPQPTLKNVPTSPVAGQHSDFLPPWTHINITSAALKAVCKVDEKPFHSTAPHWEHKGLSLKHLHEHDQYHDDVHDHDDHDNHHDENPPVFSSLQREPFSRTGQNCSHCEPPLPPTSHHHFSTSAPTIIMLSLSPPNSPRHH